MIGAALQFTRESIVLLPGRMEQQVDESNGDSAVAGLMSQVDLIPYDNHDCQRGTKLRNVASWC